MITNFSRSIGFLLLLLTPFLTSCDVFSLREPEPPISESGTFRQPDVADDVVDNLQAAIRELNVANYTRSLASDLSFQPTSTAEQRDAIWSGWSRAEEQAYFTQLVAAANTGGQHSLELNDAVMTAISETHFSFEAGYVLTVQHGRAEVPTVVQGQLVWRIVQDEDSQWRLREWTDHQRGTAPSWSDLKAGFSQ